MAIIMDLDFSNFCYSATTTATVSAAEITTSDGGYDLTDWFPVEEWEALSGDDLGLCDVIDSMTDDDNVVQHNPAWPNNTHGEYNAVSSEYSILTGDDSSGTHDFKWLRLIHLLMAAAEALTGANKCHELARVILVRFKELVSPNDGTNMERLVTYFANALQSLLHNFGVKKIGDDFSNHFNDEHHIADVLAAFQLLHDMSPYVKFGYFTANQAILEAVANDIRIHIVDFDIMDGVQWASLMQTLASSKDGPPTAHLKITALSRGGSGRRSFSTVRETGRRLNAFAALIGLSFSFHQCKFDKDGKFNPSSLKLADGEVIICNCMLDLPHYNYGSSKLISSFLSGCMTLNPRVITLVEEESGSTCEAGFAGHFMDSLHHYSAMYDSLEAGLHQQDWARVLVERVFLGPRIAESVSRIYHERAEEKPGSWGQWLASVGCQPISVSFANQCQAKLLLGLYSDGYRVEKLNGNKLVLEWKSRRLLSASVWTSHDNDV